MTEYNYDQHRVTLDNKDRSKNTATDIQGYPLDIQLDSGWRGLSADSGRIRADHTTMNDVADEIDRMISDLQNSNSSGTPAQIIAMSGQARYGPETWFAAKSLKSASDKVATTVSQYSNDLLANLQAASRAIRTVTGNYRQADHTNQQSAQSQNQNLEAGGQSRSFG